MPTLIHSLIALIALIHAYILYFEMFAWERRGPKVFSTFPAELFAPTKVLAANQGLYNGFLAAGLSWSFFISDPTWQTYIRTFFLLCITSAGCYGALTAERRIFFIQALPAILTLILIVINL